MIHHYYIQVGAVAMTLAWLGGCATSAASRAQATTDVGASSAATAPVSAPPTVEELPHVALEPELLFELLAGEMAVQTGQGDVAAQMLSRAAHRTQDPRIVERAAMAAFHVRDFEQALRMTELWIRLRPRDIEAHEAMAAVWLELDRLQDVPGELDHILELAREQGHVEQGYLRIASLLSRHGSREFAAELMQSLVRRHPNSVEAQLYAAHLAVRAGDLVGAARFTDGALQLRPGWEEAAQFRARIFISQDDTAGARAFFDGFLARHPAAGSIRLSYARFLADQRQWSSALEQFEVLQAQNPGDVEIAYATGLLSLQTNQLEKAQRFLARVLELSPDHGQARFYLGQTAEQAQRYDEAIKWYRTVDSEEGYFEARTRIARVLARQGDIEAARRQLHSIQPQNPAQHAQRVLIEEQMLREAKRLREALDVLNHGLAVVPGDKNLLYARALAAEKLDMLDLAEADLRAILEKNPNDVDALNALGYTLADRTTRYREAYVLLRQASELKPDDPFILDSLGWVYYRVGNYVDAIRHLRRALVLRSDAEIAAHLGEVLWVSGERQEAESVWNRALTATPESDVLQGVIRKFVPSLR